MKRFIQENPFVALWLAAAGVCVLVALLRSPAALPPGPPWDEDGQAAQYEDLQGRYLRDSIREVDGGE